jgi:ribosome-associated translation inhibitor RaiA
MPLIYAAALLPLGSVFLVMAVNCIFAIWAFNSMPHSAEVTHLITQQGPALISRALTVQIVVGIFTHMLVRSATNAIVRADRADAIAVLERTLARKDRAEAEQKQLLEASINDIVQVIARIAQNPSLSIEVDANKPFWQIDAALNNLRKRLVRLSQEVEGRGGEADQIKRALSQLSFYLQQRPASLTSSWQQTGTPVDQVVWQLATHFQQQTTRTSSRKEI